MQNDKVVQPTSRGKKFFRALIYLTALVALVLAGAHLVWKYSGSNTWNQTMNKNGIQVYSKKVPGSTLEQFRAVTRVKATLNHSIGSMVLADLQTCAASIPGCEKLVVIHPWNEQPMLAEWMWSMDFGPHLKEREFLVKTMVSVDRPGRTVQVENVAYPNELPRNACCFRVENMHNTWRYTSLGDGEVQVEILENMDVGMPYFLFNSQGSEGLYDMFATLPTLINDPKFQNARFGFADDIEPPATVASRGSVSRP